MVSSGSPAAGILMLAVSEGLDGSVLAPSLVVVLVIIVTVVQLIGNYIAKKNTH